MKQILKIFLAIFILINLCACQNNPEQELSLQEKIKKEKIFKVGINDDSKPFAYLDENGDIVGFDADLIKEISKRIFDTDKIIEFKILAPSNRILSLSSGEVDVVISTMTINQDRLRIVDFSNPYFMSGQAVMVSKQGNIRSGKDLNGKKVGIVLGTTAASNIRYVASNAIIRGFKNYKEALIELGKGNLDAISTDDVILQAIVSDNENYKILPDRYSTEFYGIAIRKDEKSKSLKNAINESLVALEKKGITKKLERKYNIDYRR